jgi:hypothetical protein
MIQYSRFNCIDNFLFGAKITNMKRNDVIYNTTSIHFKVVQKSAVTQYNITKSRRQIIVL